MNTEITKSTNHQIVEVDFAGGKLEAIFDGKDVWASVRRICETLGIQPHGQTEKLKTKAWACTQIICAHDTTGRNQDAFVIHLDSLPMWLAGINETKVAEAIRPMLVKYQKEAAKVLRDHFFGAPKKRISGIADSIRLRSIALRETREQRLAEREARLAREKREASRDRRMRDAIKLAEKIGLPDDQIRMMRIKQIETLAGCKVEQLPQASTPPDGKYHSATDIAVVLGTTPNRVGRISTKLFGASRRPIPGMIRRETRDTEWTNGERDVYLYSDRAVGMITEEYLRSKQPDKGQMSLGLGKVEA